MGRSTTYIIGFAAVVCLVCGVLVSSLAVALKPLQDANAVLDRQKKVLIVAGLMGEGEDKSPADIQTLFDTRIKPRVVNLKTGAYADIEARGDIDAATFDQLKAQKDPATSEAAPANKAKVQRLPNHALVYLVLDEQKKVTKYILPIEGKGLWSTLYGFVAFETDLNTIAGLTFYQHGETPGLGGEIDNPLWKKKWIGRKGFDASGAVKIAVKKGAAGPVAEDPYHVDGLSGATLTCNGVTHLVQFWLGDSGFGPYLKTLKGKGGAS